MVVDINCDIGEGIGNEEMLMPYMSSANIACGFHAGDEEEMKKMIGLCLKYNVAIGAHPSFRDKKNFGRTEMNLSGERIREIITEQLITLNNITIAGGGKLHHVKLHGALYNMAAKNSQLATFSAEAVKDFNPALIYYGLSGSVMIHEAMKSGLQIAHEVFADRTYQPDGSLTPRSVPGALITDTGQAIKQVMKIVTEQKVMAIDGENISIIADTICIHGDGPNAVAFAEKIYMDLESADIGIRRVEKK